MSVELQGLVSQPDAVARAQECRQADAGTVYKSPVGTTQIGKVKT